MNGEAATTDAAEAGTVYLLGAGFSKAASPAMPVMWELAEQVLMLLKLSPDTLDSFNQDLESWLSFLAVPQPWLDEATNLRNRARYIEVSAAICEVINRNEQIALASGPPVWLQRLAWQMSQERAAIVTFNYDLLVERICMHLRRGGGFSDLYVAPLMERMRPGTGIAVSRNSPPAHRVSLYKLHGSTNWFSGGHEGVGQSGAYVVRDHGGWSPDGADVTADTRYADLQPMVIPPIATKSSLYGSEVLRACWIRAATALRSCSELTIIGYSFPVTDTSTVAMVTDCLPREALITVIDASVEVCDRLISRFSEYDRVRSFSGPMAVADYVQERCLHLVEWGVTTDPSTGQETPHLCVNGTDTPSSDLPDAATLKGPAEWNLQNRFSRWVGEQWPGATTERLPSPRFDHAGGLGFSLGLATSQSKRSATLGHPAQ